MGCCMGKYTTRPKKTNPPDDQISVRTQDKLVITQPPPPPATIPPSPLSSNFTPSTTTTTSSSLSLDTAPRTSCSSATSFESKDDSVWAGCVKENPHSVRRHPIQGTPLPPPRPDSPRRRQRIPQPRKAEAARSNPPAHHRCCHEGSRIPGSKLHRTTTSPGRRYRGDKNWGSSPTRGNRGGTENRRNINDNRGGMARDVCSSCKRCSCHDGGGFSSNEEAVSRNTTRFGGDGRCVRRNGVAQQRFQEMECRGKEESPENCDRDSDIAEEDIDNPLIALDCFIFL